MKNLIVLTTILFLSLTVFGQTTEPCHTEANKEFLKTELKSLTDTYKTILADCNSQTPTESRNDCEDDLSHLKQNIEKLTAMNTLAETLGCNYIFSRDDKPCTGGKYCQSYKIEEQSQSANSSNISTEDVKSQYNSELTKIKAQNRQEFFEMIYKIIGLLVDNSDNSGILAEIKKLINGETKAASKYTILDENQSYIDDDGKRQGYKVLNKDGSSTFALDTDGDGKVDRAITYDKNNKVVAEHPMAKKRTSGLSASTKILSKNGSQQQFNFYNDCITTLDVKGFKGVSPAWEQRTHEYLFIIGARVQDCGESNWNITSPTGDVGLIVQINGHNTLSTKRRLFGPSYQGIDDDTSQKYEWLSYCSMRYNNFAIADLDGNPSCEVKIQAIEGDDNDRWQGADDTIFKAIVSTDKIRRGNIAVTGTCDIAGKCATLYFAIGKYNLNNGKFWVDNLPSNIPSTSLVSTLAKGTLRFAKKSVLHPISTSKDLGKDLYSATKKSAGYIYDVSQDHHWAVIEYADGFCIFNRFRGKRTIEDVIKHSKGYGDCDWWPWPEGSKHVCLDSQAHTLALVKTHGKIKDIRWIDHPTKNCGK